MRGALRGVLTLGFFLWALGAWAQPYGAIEFSEGAPTQHANDAGRGYIDIPFETQGLPAGASLVPGSFACSMQRNPFPNAATTVRCAEPPVIRPAPVWEDCRALGELMPHPAPDNNRHIWRIHAPREDRYTFQVRARVHLGDNTADIYSPELTSFLDMRTNPPHIKGPRNRRVSLCTDVRIPVRTESQPFVWYTREGAFPEVPPEHAPGNPCFPYKVEFHVPLLQHEFHAGGNPTEQPGWHVAPGQTLHEQMRIQDIWMHPATEPLHFSIHCDTTTPPSVRFLHPRPPDSPLPVALFAFDSDIADATFQCALDGAPFAPCLSPYLVRLGAAGADTVHRFSVRATNAVGLQGEVHTQSWMRTQPTGAVSGLGAGFLLNPRNLGAQHSSMAAVEGTAPAGTRLLALMSAPPELDRGFVANCHLEVGASGAWRCPVTDILYDGEYALEVHAWNATHQYSSTSIDRLPVREGGLPNTMALGTLGGERRPRVISQGEPGEETVAFVVTWPGLVGPGLEGPGLGLSALQCRLDGEAYVPCSTHPAVFSNDTPAGIAAPPPGLHRFQVRVRAEALSDTLENATPLEYIWARVDGTDMFKPSFQAPHGAEDGSFSWIGGTSLVVSGKAEPFLPLSIYVGEAEEPACERVEVKPDGSWACEIADAEEGSYAVTAWIDVLPKDEAQRYWTTHSFRFLRGNPKTFLTRRPYKYEKNNWAVFEFASPRRQVSFECKLDEGAFERCESPARISGLAQGAHAFHVRAVDFAGQSEPEPVSWHWTVGQAPASGCLASTALASEGLWALLALGVLACHRRK